MVRVKWFDNLAYYIRYLAVYVIYIGIFLLAGYGKLSGSESAPLKMFANDIVGKDPIILHAGWTLDGIGEICVALLMIASIVTGEWRIGAKKQFTRIGVSVSMLLFGVMSVGMSIAGSNSGSASLWFYFAGSVVVYLMVRHDEREAEYKEVRTGVTVGTKDDHSKLPAHHTEIRSE